jgi:hypothetical protein
MEQFEPGIQELKPLSKRYFENNEGKDMKPIVIDSYIDHWCGVNGKNITDLQRKSIHRYLVFENHFGNENEATENHNDTPENAPSENDQITTSQKMLLIERMRDEGLSWRKIADIFGITHPTIFAAYRKWKKIQISLTKNPGNTAKNPTILEKKSDKSMGQKQESDLLIPSLDPRLAKNKPEDVAIAKELLAKAENGTLTYGAYIAAMAKLGKIKIQNDFEADFVQQAVEFAEKEQNPAKT